MAKTAQAESPIHPTSLRKHRARRRRDRWLAALMAGLVVAMLAGLARRVDLQTTPPGEERVPSILLD